MVNPNPTKQDVWEYFDKWEEILNNVQTKCFGIIDMSSAGMFPLEIRQEIGKGGKMLERKYSEKVNRLCFVVPNALVNFLMKAINLFLNPIIKQSFFKRLDEAFIFAKKENEKLQYVI